MRKRVSAGVIFLHQRETRVVGEDRPGTLGHAGYEAMSMRSIVREAQNAYRKLRLTPANFVMY